MTTCQSTREEVLDEISKHFWIHSIELGDGIVTPGAWPADNVCHKAIMTALDDVDFKGKRVLDIGCLDGLFSFESERRGAAEVYATDLVSQVTPPRDTCFQVASRILGSKVKYFPHLSVFDITQLGLDCFDIVLFLGVFYHLKDPLLAFARLRQVMKEGAIIVVEGQAILPERPPAASCGCSVPSVGQGSWAKFYYRDPLGGDRSNWWVPTISCLRDWVECSFFEIEKEYPSPYHNAATDPQTTQVRHIIKARAVRREDPNIGFPDDELKDFDMNVYN